MGKIRKNIKEEKQSINHQGKISTADQTISDELDDASKPDVALDKTPYERNLRHYEIIFSKTLQKTYPEIDRAAREQLQQRSQDLGLTTEDVAKIEDQATAKAIAYRANLQRYQQIFRDMVRKQFPIDPQIRRKLKQQQRLLDLEEADITAIENKITSEKVTAGIQEYRKSLYARTAAFVKNKPPKIKTTGSELDVTIHTPITPKLLSTEKIIGIVILLVVVGIGTWVFFQKQLRWLTMFQEKSVREEYQSGKSVDLTAQLVVRSNVSKDNVYIDTRWVGPTGPSSHALTAGEHKIRVEKPGYESFEAWITLAKEEKETIHVQLMPEGQPPGKIFQDKLKDGSLGPKMIVIPSGEFLMGSLPDEPMRYDGEGPQHWVRIVRSFAIGVTEITFEDYDRFAKATNRKLPNDEGWGRGKRPVINVSWHDAKAYAKWLGKQAGGKQYRLSTEAEWEYAARADTITPFSSGGCIHTDQANYKGNYYDYADCGAKTNVSQGKTIPVGTLPANPWGLHEMHGNVWEWTADCWHYHYKNAPTDGRAWGKENDGYCSERVVRGGGWGSGPRSVRSAVRIWDWADVTSTDLGFRLVRVLQP
uniref:Formylglycine-generating enzyme, required for sulfatase activity, contains SUMF1/FGE domain n=1 Tax=Candidatus Kentrum sp. TUN TaxID=2126343 RepID=A0A450ZRE5_9GAMM|nr:MAG: Formylglycine-generating enzyme, required for sulfatase activity, contains SUMF1/FGE domain [Candidatus Kentron sp. TUN]